ncbi:UDP-2,4-diacetamido-2,4,6-trideoxy-beta-L-altropyranose hydrolase [Koleobacter methoxysyntrophicus]|nr:UDP-2,4-diacetamido-2,4,6-trideoxy-beta-L-altropyranose hydrolase [Koleobacter methoxysyntrophicus]
MEEVDMNKIGFRVDAGPNIGFGHIMRCLSLAVEFRKQGYEVYFLSKMKDGIVKIKESGFNVIQLNYKKTTDLKEGLYELQREAKEIIYAIKEYGLDLLFIDSYNVTEEYFLEIKPHVKKIGYIDDLNKFVYPVDILINGNIAAEYMDYKKYSEDEVMLLGPKYNLLREEFRNLPDKVINEEVKEIMITTGGSDPYNMSYKILKMILDDEELKDLTINVIIGNGFSNKEELRKIKEKNKNVILHENIKEISEIMLKSDIAISAGGSTLYELCACGTPTLAFIMADNQEFIVKKMDELGYLKSLGWYYNLDDKKLLKLIKTFIKDYSLRIKLKNKGRSLINAKGVVRIVELISTL